MTNEEYDNKLIEAFYSAMSKTKEKYPDFNFDSKYFYFSSDIEKKEILGIRNICCFTKRDVSIGTFNLEQYNLGYEAIKFFEELIVKEIRFITED